MKPLTFPDYKLLGATTADIKTNIPGVTSKQQLPAELQAYTKDMIDTCYNQDNWTQIYTDGSAVEAVRNGGAGVYVRFTDVKTTKLSFSGGQRCTNYKAELLAIKEAIAFLLERNNLFNKVVLFTDSLSALQALESDPTDDFIAEILTLVQRLCETTTLVLQWVPAHIGLYGNEIADKLAKEGSLLEQPVVPLSYSEAKSILRSIQKEEWIALNLGYRADQDSFNKLDRNHQTIIFRLRTGHCRLNSHTFKLGLVPSANCSCDTVAQTPEHILQTCPRYTNDRKRIWPRDLDLKAKLWGTVEDLKNTAQFILDIKVKL